MKHLFLTAALRRMAAPVAFVAFVAATMAACSKPDPAAVAANVAKQYYEQLVSGQYAAFVDAQYRADSIPASYRSQLIDNARMFMDVQQKEHLGIRQVSVATATADTASHTAQVFLVLCFGDSTSEEVLVPMVEHGGVWWLR